MLPPILLLSPKQPTLPSVHPTLYHASLLTTAHAATAPMTGAANPMMPASSMSHAPVTALEHSHWPDLSGMRLNCHMSSRDNLLSRRINCSVASLAKDLPSRRLNCSSAMSATNPCIAQCTRCHESRLASPLKHLAVALQIRACYGLRPYSSE